VPHLLQANTLARRLILMIACALLPVGLFALAGTIMLAQAQRDDFQRSLAETTRALGSAVDNELLRTLAVVEALSVTAVVASGHLPSMYELSQSVLRRNPTWDSIVVTTPEGGYLYNTRRPLGERLPQTVLDPELVQEVSRSQAPAVGNLIVSQVARRPLFTARVPVVIDGRTRYVISLGATTETLRAILQQQVIPEQATVAVLDRNLRIAARSRQHEQFVGNPATPTLQAMMDGRQQGFGEARTQDGQTTFTAFSTSARTGWSVVIGLPLENVLAPQRKAYLALLIGFGLSVVLSGFAALAAARGILRPITELRDAAADISRGAEVREAAGGLAELREVSTTLAATSRSLRESQRLRGLLLEQEQRARAVAERASKDKDEFLSMLSHELRNPLAVISNAAELLRRLPPDSGRVAGMHAILERQIRHLGYLINDLLDVSRAVTGKIAVHRVATDLAACVQEAVQALDQAGVLAGHPIELRQQPAWINGDRERLQQVVSNLVGNAAKYSPPGTTIAVELSVKEGKATLSVTDQGIGMDEPTRARVFDLFFQHQASPARSEGGLGVGLTLTRKLVELHAGAIEARSAGPGQGSVFIVTLPCIEPPAAS
jgi:signal transduction histidine kinase